MDTVTVSVFVYSIYHYDVNVHGPLKEVIRNQINHFKYTSYPSRVASLPSLLVALFPHIPLSLSLSLLYSINQSYILLTTTNTTHTHHNARSTS
jgi:hypothetical protein